jgi:hypothetical protein
MVRMQPETHTRDSRIATAEARRSTLPT